MEAMIALTLDRSPEGSARRAELWVPGGDARFRRHWAELEEDNASPQLMEALFRRAFASDVRPVLGSVSAPTVVLHRKGSVVMPIAAGRYLAEHIPGATFTELSGDDTFPFVGDIEPLASAVEEFVTGKPAVFEPDRVLVTAPFTDIVGSTERANDLGDRRWRDLLDDYDAMSTRQLERFRGRLVNRTGDGMLAVFDGPGRAIRCAEAIREGARYLGMQVRAGVHTGECEIRGDDYAGIALHIGARIGAVAGAGEILVSSVLPPLVAGSGISFADRGVHELRGVPGKWQVLATRD